MQDPPTVTGSPGKTTDDSFENRKSQPAESLPEVRRDDLDVGELERKTYNLYILYHASRALGAVLDMEELLDISIDMTTEVMSVEWGLFYLVNEQQDVLEIRRCKGIESAGIPQTLRIGEGVADWAKTGIESIPFSEVGHSAALGRAFPDLSGLSPLQPTFLVPLFHRVRFVGLVVLGGRFDREDYSENDLELLSTMVTLSANALVNAHLYELAILDGVTKLFVVRYFKQRLAEELKRAKRYNQPLSLIMMDLDYFKLVNDSYGHPSGDKVLADIGGIIRKRCREGIDIACRYGGEEFAVLMPETDLQGACLLAERIRSEVEGSRFLKEEIRLTLSAGVASYPEDAATQEELIEKADMALYEAKHLGRNRVVSRNRSTLNTT